MENRIINLADQILSGEPKRRPEAEWLQGIADRMAEAEGFKSRSEMDRLIYEKMYGRAPKKNDTTKIRYWRTGRHLPASREEALMLARVLQMKPEEQTYFLQAYMEKSDRVFQEEPKPEDVSYGIYRSRRERMEEMVAEYIDAIPPARMLQLNIPYENLSAYARHLYCMDALNMTAFFEELRRKGGTERHLTSNNYEAEFLRIRRLLGEIPRRVILRQIIIMGIPYLNRRLVDEKLVGLGYLPLTEGHTSPKGALVDDLMIGFLKLYEEVCAGQDPLVCRSFIMEQLGRLDRYLLERGKEEYRLLYFRVLSTMIGYGEE